MIEDDGLPSAFTTAHELGMQGSRGGGREGRAPFRSLWVCAGCSEQGWAFVFFFRGPLAVAPSSGWACCMGPRCPGHPLRPLFSPAGHVFNMPHDNVKVCEEVFGKLRGNHMMSPTLIQIDRANPWSACSAAVVTDFLDSGHGERGLGRWAARPICLLLPTALATQGAGLWRGPFRVPGFVLSLPSRPHAGHGRLSGPVPDEHPRLPQETASWTSPASPSPCPRTCRVPATR